MKYLKRSQWFHITCDLAGCTTFVTVHPSLHEPDEPVGWFFIKPPHYWKGPALSFCSQDHRDMFVGEVIRPQLTSGEEGK